VVDLEEEGVGDCDSDEISLGSENDTGFVLILLPVFNEEDCAIVGDVFVKLILLKKMYKIKYDIYSY